MVVPVPQFFAYSIVLKVEGLSFVDDQILRFYVEFSNKFYLRNKLLYMKISSCNCYCLNSNFPFLRTFLFSKRLFIVNLFIKYQKYSCFKFT